MLVTPPTKGSSTTGLHSLPGQPTRYSPGSKIDINADYIWTSLVPIKVKIFDWLLFRDRLNLKANLFRKSISTDSTCPRCDHHMEDALHIFLLCPKAAQVWRLLGLRAATSIGQLWNVITTPGLDANIWPTVLLVIL